MNISISQTKPITKPVREYETRFVYIGFRFRYDTHAKTISSIFKHPGGKTDYFERPCDSEVFSQAHHSEHVRVIVYSDSPKVWCEEMSPDDYFVFSELSDKILR
jgi:hypothetical protein